MTFSYEKLWSLLKQKNMKKKDLREATKISSATLAKLGKNENVNMRTIGDICKVLNCNIGDIVEYKEGEDN